MALYRPRGPGCKCHAVLAQWRGGSVLPHPRCCARHACNWGDWQAARWPGAAPVITPPGRKWHAARTGGLAAACAAMPGHQRHVKPRRAHQCGRKCPGWLSGATRGLGDATVAPAGFEPTPFRNGALSHRLKPLGQTVFDGVKTDRHNTRHTRAQRSCNPSRPWPEAKDLHLGTQDHTCRRCVRARAAHMLSIRTART